MKNGLLIAFLVFCCCISYAQEKSSKKLNVFFDCAAFNCDFDYVRTEIKWVDFVRDRFDADVHIQVKTQSAGSGGTQYQLEFNGQKKFAGRSDTLSYFSDPNATNDELRQQMTRYLKLGLVNYAARTTLANNIEVAVTGQKTDSAVVAKAEKDPWNQWVFNISASGSLYGSQNYKYSGYNGGVSAERITEKMKSTIYSRYRKQVNKSTFGSETIVVRIQTTNIYTEQVFSINNHWSWGAEANYSNSLFDNNRSRITFSPKVEYNFFPYSLNTSKRFVVAYSVGVSANRYYDTTIYFKTKETLPLQTASAMASFTQKWGSVNVGVFWSNYLDDFKKNNLGLNGALDLRLFRGVTLSLYGNYSIIHDQISLPKGAATRDDVLTQRRVIASSYDYSTGMGIRYRFGSKTNNVVNPRFSGLSYSVSF